MKLTDLPNSVREIAEVIGIEPAMRLINQLPTCLAGTEGHKSVRPILYVPKRLKPDHRLVEILGWHDALRLVEHFGGEILYPANCREVERGILRSYAMQLIAIGYRPELVAEKLGVTVRTVRNIVRAENPQEETSGQSGKDQQVSTERSA